MRTLTDVVDEINSWTYVAGELHKRGIKGVKDKCSACPLAVYLLAETGADSVAVFFDHVTIEIGGNSLSRYLEPHVSEFIEDFDGGLYSVLDVTA